MDIATKTVSKKPKLKLDFKDSKYATGRRKKSGQAGAMVHGIAKALILFDSENRAVLKTEKLNTRDSRSVERKKPGRRKARRSFQFSKR